MKKRKLFSFIEVMISLTLLLLIAGTIGWQVYGVLERKRFLADLEKLKTRCLSLQRLSLTTQTDWKGILTPEGKNWIFQSVCLDTTQPIHFSPLKLKATEVLLNGQQQELINIEFFSSGKIKPNGTLLFQHSAKSSQIAIWELPKMFGIEEGDGAKQLGPIHPDEIQTALQ